MTELERLKFSYQIAKEMGFHTNAYWTSIKRTIDRLEKAK